MNDSDFLLPNYVYLAVGNHVLIESDPGVTCDKLFACSKHFNFWAGNLS